MINLEGNEEDATSTNILFVFSEFYDAVIKHHFKIKTAECDAACGNHTAPPQAPEIAALFAPHRALLLFRFHRSPLEGTLPRSPVNALMAPVNMLSLILSRCPR